VCGNAILFGPEAQVQIINHGMMLVSLSIDSGGGMGSADDWASGLAKEKKASEKRALDQAQATAMSRNIIAEQMPTVWDDLLKEFQEHCRAYNDLVKPERPLALHGTGAHDFMVRPDAMDEIVRGHYDEDPHKISIVTARRTEIYQPQAVLEGSGRVALLSRSTGAVVSLASIARKAIEIGVRGN
jgi:hypothetical protein